MEFDKIILQPMSWNILLYTFEKNDMKSENIAEGLNLSTKQVDAAITKTLVRHGFLIRLGKMTRLMKKEYNVIHLTDRGKRYIEWRLQKENKRG